MFFPYDRILQVTLDRTSNTLQHNHQYFDLSLHNTAGESYKFVNAEKDEVRHLIDALKAKTQLDLPDFAAEVIGVGTEAMRVGYIVSLLHPNSLYLGVMPVLFSLKRLEIDICANFNLKLETSNIASTLGDGKKYFFRKKCLIGDAPHVCDY